MSAQNGSSCTSCSYYKTGQPKNISRNSRLVGTLSICYFLPQSHFCRLKFLQNCGYEITAPSSGPPICPHIPNQNFIKHVKENSSALKLITNVERGKIEYRYIKKKPEIKPLSIQENNTEMKKLHYIFPGLLFKISKHRPNSTFLVQF